MPSAFQRWKEPRHGPGVSLVLIPVQSLEFLFFESDDHKVEPEKKETCHKEKEKYTKPVLTNHGRLKDVTAALITAIIIDPNKFHS